MNSPDVRLVINQTICTNRRFVSGSFVLSKEYRAFRKLVCEAASSVRLHCIRDGLWEIRIASYWPRLRHFDIKTACADVDAPVKAVLDALQYANVIDDDMRFVQVLATKHYDKQNPRIEIEMRRVQ